MQRLLSRASIAAVVVFMISSMPGLAQHALASNNEMRRIARIEGRVSIANAGAQDLAGAVVFLDAHPSLGPTPESAGERPQIAQRNKAFQPTLLVVSRGTTVEFPNWDPFSHNVFSRSRVAQFDLDRYEQGASKSYTFENPGVVQLFCNIHPQMKAVVLVTPNRCFTRADAEGRFAIDGAPPGRYVLIAWHGRAGEQRLNIDVPPQGLRDVDIQLSAEPRREPAATRRRPAGPAGVERGLGMKRERLNLPVVSDAHPAPRD